jgi:RNA polymerase sigma factor (sigma-70 family)
MNTGNQFAEFIQRIRNQDESAARELIQEYEHELRTFARVRLNDPRLRRVLDSMDICQSILANFFARAADGQFDLESPQDLMNLLVRMVENKVHDKARAQKRQKRNMQRLDSRSIEDVDLAGSDETPSAIVSSRELLEKIRERMPPELLQIADMRRDGQNWKTISESLGEPAETLRKRFERAISRLIMDLHRQDFR